MADSEDDIGQLGASGIKAATSYAAAAKANDQIQAAYDEMLRNWKERMGDYDALGNANYQPITAQQVGPSALDNIQNDAAARQAQLEALASLSDLASSGGLSLGDMKALNDIQGNLNRNTLARRKGLANEFAARGQLGSGAQLAMGLQGNSDAAMNANAAGESAAAQAQARAMQALLQKGQMARGMSNDDYARQAEAARARDAIEARNAAARTDASKYNNQVAHQGFADNLARAQGKTSLTNSMNRAIFGQGTQGANTTLGFGSALNDTIGQGVGQLGKLAKNYKPGSGGSSDDSNPDLTGDRGGAADIAGGDKGDIDAEPGVDYGSSDPSEWENPY